MALLNAGLGVFKFELRQVFLSLKLHECAHVAQLFFNSARVGGDKVEVGQRNRDLTAPNFETTYHIKSVSSCLLIWEISARSRNLIAVPSQSGDA